MKGTIYVMMMMLLCSSIISGIAIAQSHGDEGAVSHSNPLVANGVDSYSRSFFTENKGQWNKDLLFVGMTDFGRVEFWKNKINYVFFHEIGLINDSKGSFQEVRVQQNENNYINNNEYKKISFKFVGSMNSEFVGQGQLIHISNFFYGNDSSKWVVGVKNYQEVVCRNIWENIDVKYYYCNEKLKYDFILHPGSDPDDIRVNVLGNVDLSISETCCSVRNSDGIILEDKDLKIVTSDNDQIEGKFTNKGRNIYGFSLGKYDTDDTVIIDPLIFSTFVGNGGNNGAYAIDVDEYGNSYVVGVTDSSSFPTTSNAYDGSFNGNADVVMIKLSSDGSSLLYSTYIGGTSTEVGYGLDVDDSGNAYIVGYTQSSDFPTTSGAFDSTLNGTSDIFLVKLNSNGSALLVSTFIGGDGTDGEAVHFNKGINVCVGPDNSIYISGTTRSSNFPIKDGAYDETYNSNKDVFVLKMDSQGTSLINSTYIGGSNTDEIYSMFMDSEGYLYIVGTTLSDDFPLSDGAYDSTMSGLNDGYVVKLYSNCTDIIYSTYIGGSNLDYLVDVYVNDDGEAYITGMTKSSNFPTTVGSYDTHYDGSQDIILLKMSSSGSSLVYSTFIGGTGGEEWGFSIDVDSQGNAYVIGETFDSNFPVVDTAFDKTIGGARDFVLFEMDHSGTRLINSTFMGGASYDRGTAIKLDPNTNIFNYCGVTGSSDFPSTTGSYDPVQTSFRDIAIGKMAFGPIFEFSNMVLSPYSPRTGQELQISVDLTHKVEGANINVSFNYGEDGVNFTSIRLSESSNITYSGSIIVNNTFNKMYFFFEARSGGSIVLRTDEQYTLVEDVYAPVILEDTSDKIAIRNSSYNFNISVWDNIEVVATYVNYWFDASIYFNHTLSGKGSYYGIINIPGVSSSLLRYYVSARDAQGNWVNGPTNEIPIISQKYGMIYSTDFSSDPEWETTDPSRYYWDQYAETYHLEMVDNSDDFARQGVELTYNSFVMSFDLLIEDVDWAGDLNIGLFSNSMKGYDDPDQMVAFAIGVGDLGKGIGLNVVDRREEMKIDSRYPTNSWDYNVWYHVCIRYNREMGSVLMTLTRITDGMEMINLSVNGLVGFSDLQWFGASKVGDYYAPGATASGVIDNIFIFEGHVDSEKVQIEDISPSVGSTGDPYEFTFLVDNHQIIIENNIEYWFDDSVHQNLSVNVSSRLRYSIIVDSQARSLHYRYHAVTIWRDSIHTEIKTVIITDDDPPEIVFDNSSKNASTGDMFEFMIVGKDNIGIESVIAEYWYNDGIITTIELNRKNETFFENSIVIPSDMDGFIHYIVHIYDHSGNHIFSRQKNIPIVDNDPPLLIDDLSDNNCRAGYNYSFHIKASDNIGILKAHVEYWFRNNSVFNVLLYKEGSDYFGTILIPYSLVTILYYRIEIIDVFGNAVITNISAKQIQNDLISKYFVLGHQTVYLGATISDIIVVPDDILIYSTSWTEVVDDVVIMNGIDMPPTPGDYMMEIIVMDISGNYYSFMFGLTILPLDNDADSDGIPDLVEVEWGLSPSDPNDALIDQDGDNLTNYQEYLNGTDINDPDTDGDGMPDGWEVKYGFDPTRFSAIMDSDNDGRSDLEEYYESTNPRVKDSTQESPSSESIPLYLIVITASILVVAILLLIIQSVRASKMKQKIEEVELIEKKIEGGGDLSQESLPQSGDVGKKEALPESTWKAGGVTIIEQGISGIDIPTLEEDIMNNQFEYLENQLSEGEGEEEGMDYQRPDKKYPIYLF